MQTLRFFAAKPGLPVSRSGAGFFTAECTENADGRARAAKCKFCSVRRIGASGASARPATRSGSLRFYVLSFLRLLRFFAAKTRAPVRPSVRAADKGELISRKEAQNTQKRKRGIVPGSPFISDGCGRRTPLQRGWPYGVPSFLRILRFFAAKPGPCGSPALR